MIVAEVSVATHTRISASINRYRGETASFSKTKWGFYKTALAPLVWLEITACVRVLIGALCAICTKLGPIALI